MADMKKYLDTVALGALVDQIKAEDAKVLAASKKHTDDSLKLYETAGSAATAEQNAKAYTDALANGQVATNKADIAKLNGDASTEGSVAKAIADAKALIDADVEDVEAIANKNKEDIAAINNAETGILAQANAHTNTEVGKVQESVDNLAEFVGVIPDGYEATTVAEYAKELADAVAANGYDDTALAAKVDANASAITALQGKDGELVAKDEELAAAIAAVKEDVDAFFADADMTESAKDTLKELQTYIASDETAASQMAASIKQNADAIGELQTAGVTQDEKIAALESKFGGAEGSVEDMIADAQAAAEATAAADATAKANQALDDAKSHADTEVGKDRARLDALEAIDHEHKNFDLLETYTQTEENLADAVAKKHEHSNLSVLEGVTAAKIQAWDAAEDNAKTYADGLNTTMSERVDGIGSKVTALEDASKTHALASDLTAAVERIAANETAIAANTSAINSFTAITAEEVAAMFA